MYPDCTVYIVGESKTASNNPITQHFTHFFIGFVINRETHEIIDAECSAMLSLTNGFIKAMFVGKSMNDVEDLEEDIKSRYFGSSQKALMIALRNAGLKYRQQCNII